MAIPLSADDVLRLDASISDYTSASSSNIDPFELNTADPFIASSGASHSDTWYNGTLSFEHSSDDRNTLWGAKASFSSEYDYSSVGFGGSFARLFNEKNTELSVHANVYFDTWSTIYPYELRPFQEGREGIYNPLFNLITGNTDYNPANFKVHTQKGRNSYALGFGFSQILSKNLQASLALDGVMQQGLLSTPFQRVYFADVEDAFVQNFHLADDVERLPDQRIKLAVGGRLNYYINQFLTVRTFYRFYYDDWGISSHTASIELPVKIGSRITLYPSYRFYSQTAADYFAPYEAHLSTEKYYTSDYDLSRFSANQYGFGIRYTDVFTSIRIWKIGLKSIDLKYSRYDRNTTFHAGIITGSAKFIIE